MIHHRRALYNVTDEKQDGEQVTSNKQKRRADSTAVIAQLAALFPKAFAVNHHERKPLKILDGVLRFQIIKVLPGTPPPPEPRAIPAAAVAGTADDSER